MKLCPCFLLSNNLALRHFTTSILGDIEVDSPFHLRQNHFLSALLRDHSISLGYYKDTVSQIILTLNMYCHEYAVLINDQSSVNFKMDLVKSNSSSG